jgi:hypothetical protein
LEKKSDDVCRYVLQRREQIWKVESIFIIIILKGIIEFEPGRRNRRIQIVVIQASAHGWVATVLIQRSRVNCTYGPCTISVWLIESPNY